MANKAFLGGLSAIATDDVWVVGTLVDRTVNATKILTLTAHWDGKAWTIVPSPNPPTEAPLAVVAAISSNDVWAAGGQRGDAGVGQTFLIEHWNGKHWTINPVPLIGKGDDEFSIVAFPSGNVYVAGLSFGPSPKLATQTLILHTTQGN
jgi:hypothetical protein